MGASPRVMASQAKPELVTWLLEHLDQRLE